MSPTIRILGREKPITVAAGSTLLDAITAAGFAVAADCGARGKCGRCKIKVQEGAAALPLTPIEAKRLGEPEAARGLRLACQHEAVDGLVLQVVEELYRQEVYKMLGIGLGQPLPCSPAIRAVPLPEGEIERALAAVAVTHRFLHKPVVAETLQTTVSDLIEIRDRIARLTAEPRSP